MKPPQGKIGRLPKAVKGAPWFVFVSRPGLGRPGVGAAAADSRIHSHRGEEPQLGIRRRSKASALAKAATADRMAGQEPRAEIPIEMLKRTLRGSVRSRRVAGWRGDPAPAEPHTQTGCDRKTATSGGTAAKLGPDSSLTTRSRGWHRHCEKVALLATP